MNKRNIDVIIPLNETTRVSALDDVSMQKLGELCLEPETETPTLGVCRPCVNITPQPINQNRPSRFFHAPLFVSLTLAIALILIAPTQTDSLWYVGWSVGCVIVFFSFSLGCYLTGSTLLISARSRCHRLKLVKHHVELFF